MPSSKENDMFDLEEAIDRWKKTIDVFST